MSPLVAGVLTAVLLLLATYAAFTKRDPFHHSFQLRAVFASAVNIAKDSPVRVAGVTVGSVEGISLYRGSDVAVVTMGVNDNGLPLHADATLKIRPRLFLEGDFFVDLSPGSPSAPLLQSGATIPIAQTADPVQMDQVVTALDSDTRGDLQALLASYGTALTHEPTAAENRVQDPIVRGKTAAQALNDAARRAPGALRDATIVAQALGGERVNDVSQLVSSLGRVTGALSQNEGNLQGVVTNLDIALRAFATQSQALDAAVGLLPSSLAATYRAFAALNAALPTAGAVAADLVPAVEQLPQTVSAALPWIAQARVLASQGDLGGLSSDLASAAPPLGSLIPSLTSLARRLDPVSRCFSQVIFPAGNTTLDDGPLSTGAPWYQELWYALVGVNGVGSNFDGNGSYVRGLIGSSATYFDTSPINVLGTSERGSASDVLEARASEPPQGTSPADPGSPPPLKPNVACATQSLPDYNGPAAHGPGDGPVG